jgi:hypothetical protein
MSPLRLGLNLLSLTPSLALGASLLVAACGAEEGSDPPPEPPIEFPVAVDSTNLDHGAQQAWLESGWVAEQMNAQAPRGLDLPTAPAFQEFRIAADLARLVPQLAGLQAVSWSECTPTITGYDGGGILIDSDGDGIPNDYKVDYGDACVSEVEGGVVRLTISGSRRLQDTGVGFRSFRLTTTDFVILVEYVDTDVHHRVELSGVEEGSFAPSAAHYSRSVTVREHTFDPKAPADVDRYRRIVETGEFVPAEGSALALGAPLPAGTLTYQADLGHLDHDDPLVPGHLFYHFTMATPTALEYSPSCNEGDFVAGALRGKLNGGEEAGFQLSWNGCTPLPKREFFGY